MSIDHFRQAWQELDRWAIDPTWHCCPETQDRDSLADAEINGIAGNDREGGDLVTSASLQQQLMWKLVDHWSTCIFGRLHAMQHYEIL